MSFIDKLFGSSTIIEKGTDLLDNAFYTDQEKAAGHIKLLAAYEPFKLSQRLLALSIVPMWSLCHFICFGIWLVNPNYNLDAALLILNGKIGLAASIIVGFYFAGGALNSLRK